MTTIPQDTHTSSSSQGGSSSSSSTNVIDLTGPEQPRTLFPSSLPSQTIEYVNLDSDEEQDEVQFIRQTQPSIPSTSSNAGSSRISASASSTSQTPRSPFDSLFDYMLHDSHTSSTQTPFARGAFHPLDYESPTNPYLTRLQNLSSYEDDTGFSSGAGVRGRAEVGAGAGGAGETGGTGGVRAGTGSTLLHFDFEYLDHALTPMQSLLHRMSQTVTGMYTPSRRGGRHPTGGPIRHTRPRFQSAPRRLPRSLQPHVGPDEDEFLAWAYAQQESLETGRWEETTIPTRPSTKKPEVEVAPGYTRSVDANTRLACPSCSNEFGMAEKSGGMTKLFVIMGCGHVICQDCVEPLFLKKTAIKPPKGRKAPVNNKPARAASNRKSKGKERETAVATAEDGDAEMGEHDGQEQGTQAQEEELFKMVPRATGQCPSCSRKIRRPALQQIYL
ncbi:hypothetical protein MVEG_05580 [Podila verticillata NRRL 6337]|nr:MAG: hypothetical protein BYD32DRAFT_441191 [Podila humilis]KFH68775.1 hypothetical protein MVEG_05580 [Podila verticillata NRRL 6337]